ncbi:MAG: TonB-dependent receptor [Gammaproteobacteria bacterium]|nr:TonB-dependent receptor [Gammaproteobacteria bacterium]
MRSSGLLTLPYIENCLTRILSRPADHVRSAVIAALLVACATAGAAPLDKQQDLITLPLEQLLSLEVSTASKFTQKVSEAPSAVSIVTAADIRAYGYRTLADILKRIPGLYVTYDRNYGYLGTRGFARPGDYNTRLLFLVDGYRINDPVYDGALIDTGFIVDVDLIDRVEFVPGPGSAVYGSNAVFGVINIITKKGRDIGGFEVSGEVASFDTHKGRLTYGNRDDNGLDTLLSASSYRSRGENLFFPEFDDPATNNGVAQNLDYDRSDKLFTRISAGAYTLEAGFSKRTKGIPTASYGQVFNDPRSETTDEQAFLNLKYNDRLNSSLDVSASINFGQYKYFGDYVYDYPPLTLNKDFALGRWWGGELRFLDTSLERHKLIYGAEYRDDYRQDQSNYDADPYFPYLDDRRGRRSYGLYVTDEFTVSDAWILNAGMRRDNSSMDQGVTSPRIAVIHRWTPRTTVKLLYGSAFRAPSDYEKYYNDDDNTTKINPDLRPEKIRTYEMVLEHYLHDDFRITGSVYKYKITDLINLVRDTDDLLVFQNTSTADATGVELMGQRIWNNGTRWLASYTLQQAEDGDTGVRLSASPRHLLKMNLTTPLFSGAWQAGLEVQHMSERTTPIDGTVGSNTVTNLTFASNRLAKNLELSASLYNLFDEKYADPPSVEHCDALDRCLDGITQDGRSFRVKLTYRH